MMDMFPLGTEIIPIITDHLYFFFIFISWYRKIWWYEIHFLKILCLVAISRFKKRRFYFFLIRSHVKNKVKRRTSWKFLNYCIKRALPKTHLTFCYSFDLYVSELGFSMYKLKGKNVALSHVRSNIGNICRSRQAQISHWSNSYIGMLQVT